MSDFAFKGPDPKPSPSVGGVGRPKRKRPTKANPERIAEIRAKKCADGCRLCGSKENVQAHHLIPRGMGGTIGGRWTESNICGLCKACHGLVEARDPAALYLLRASLSDAEYSYVVTTMGEGWLERKYPIRGVDAA